MPGFTDEPVTPVRLQILIDVLLQSTRGIRRDDLCRLLQPEALAGKDSKFPSATATIRAALDLELADESGGIISLIPAYRKEKHPNSVILKAFDVRVLSVTEVEKYFALFYSYLLGLGTGINQRQKQSNDAWAAQFNHDVYDDVPQPDRFNASKLTGLYRWFSFAGLGWYDPAENFQPNPYERIQRSLSRIFGKHRKLEADPFMAALGKVCPELDGGEIFCQANRGWESIPRRCTLGVSHALVELHMDAIVRLNCPADSAGWSIEDAEPPSGDDFKSARFVSVELLKAE
jgi:hypothetical protein